MFQHLFAVMNETLDQITLEYPSSSPERRLQLDEQIYLLKQACDSLIEQWLVFEEKLSDFHYSYQSTQAASAPAAAPLEYKMEAAAEPGQLEKPNSPLSTISTADSSNPPSGQGLAEAEKETLVSQAAELFTLGQGYYKLFMFQHAAQYFEGAQAESPESNLIRLYLGMTYMHLQNWNEAHRHFQLLVALTDFPKWQALGYNALGCIQAIRRNMEYAEKLFKKAYEVYPEFTDSLYNMKSCQESPAQLSLFFGSTELCCL